MFFKVIPILLLIVCVKIEASAQCKELGQTPATAFPICATSVFHQDTVPQCLNNVVPVPGCENDGVTYNDINPFWYKFTCYAGGTLNFDITPDNIGDDYDWEIFDITNASPSDVYTKTNLFVVGNWSGSSGKTGTAPGHNASIECASDPTVFEDTYSKPPILQVGHTYLLLVSHYTKTISGYSLSMMGGTAVITDTTLPRLKAAIATCNATKIGVSVNKSVKCSSLEADGSDFVLSPPLANVIGASGLNCNGSFDMDSLVLTLDKPLAPGSYQVIAKLGKNDDNTLLDNCDNSVPVNDSVPFTVTPIMPTPMDSLTPVACAPPSIQLVFKQNIQCSSIAPNGTDFVITGPNPVSIKSATGTCDANGLTTVITVQFSSPIVLAGDYQVKLVQGSDGNTIINECGAETPAGETLDFSVSDTVSASFNLQLNLGCKQDTVLLSHDGRNGVNSWKWVFDDSLTVNIQNIARVYKDYGQKSVKLFVSNGACTDSSSQIFVLDNQLKAQFSSPPFICPEDKALFKDSSIGKISTWNWYFGNGNSSNTQNPPPQGYPFATKEKYYPIRLVVEDGVPCYDTAFYELKVLYNCYISVPTAFTPNGDGKNDYLYPLNAYKATKLEFRVYNRWGQLVFETTDWTRKWDGTINGIPQASGVYAWYLIYTNTDNGQEHSSKGTTVLIR